MGEDHTYIIVSQYHGRLLISMVGLIRDGFSLRSLGLSGFIREIAFDLIVRINSKS